MTVSPDLALLIGHLQGTLEAVDGKLDTLLASHDKLADRVGLLENARARVAGAVAAVAAVAGLLGALAKSVFQSLFPAAT